MTDCPNCAALSEEIEVLREALWIAASDASPYATAQAVDEFMEMARGGGET